MLSITFFKWGVWEATLAEAASGHAEQGGAEVNKYKVAIWVALAVFLGAYFGSPLLVLHQMRAAAERKDAAALSAQIDFPALRASAKHALDMKVSRRLAAKPHRKQTTLWGAVLLTAVARNAIDDLVTPDGVAKLLASGSDEAREPPVGQRKRPPPELAFDYEGFDVFLVHAKQAGLPGEGITLVMRREGLVGWKVVGVRL